MFEHGSETRDMVLGFRDKEIKELKSENERLVSEKCQIESDYYAMKTFLNQLMQKLRYCLDRREYVISDREIANDKVLERHFKALKGVNNG